MIDRAALLLVVVVRSGWFWLLFYAVFAIAFGVCISGCRPHPNQIPIPL